LTLDTALRAALWLILLTVVASTKTDPDLWGHVRFGQDIIRDASVRQVDSYSFTSDRKWVNHEWAAEVVIAAAFNAGGNAGLVALKLLVVLGVLTLLNVTLASDGVAVGRRRDLLVGVAVITTAQQAHNVRPQLFSLLFFAALVACLLAARRDRRVLFALPLIFAAWANFHGGWIVGGGILILWTLGVAVSGVRNSAAYAAAGLASLAATFINPEGAGLVAFLRETVAFGRADIGEWQPIYALGPAIWGTWVAVAALAVFGLFQSRRTRLQPERASVVIALAIGSFQVNRLLGFFALATLFLFGAAIAAGLWQGRTAVTSRSPRATALGLVIVVVLFAGALRALAMNATCVRVDIRSTPEPGAVEFFKQHGSHGRLLVWFDWGEYALWHLAPNLRVSVDGRRETLYSAQLQDRHLRFFFDAPGGAALPGEIAADYVWIPKALPASRRLAADGWAAAYTGEQSVIFSRTRVQGIAEPARVAPAVARCFPDP
jgi:hypothetical protein